jgi:DNA-binding MarR family transcriptional regulator
MQTELMQLVNSFSEIFKSIHQRSYHKMENKCLYPGQPKLLSMIRRYEGISQKDLSEKIFVTPATITGMLGKLEANNFVYRKPDETDKRIMRVYLTQEGRLLALQGEEFLKKMTLQIFEGFTEDELHIMIAYTDRMKANLHKYEK